MGVTKMVEKKESLEVVLERLHRAAAYGESVIYHGQDLRDLISMLDELTVYRSKEENLTDIIETTGIEVLESEAILVEISVSFDNDFKNAQLSAYHIYDEALIPYNNKNFLYRKHYKRGLFENQTEFVKRMAEQKVFMSYDAIELVQTKQEQVTKLSK